MQQGRELGLLQRDGEQTQPQLPNRLKQGQGRLRDGEGTIRRAVCLMET